MGEQVAGFIQNGACGRILGQKAREGGEHAVAIDPLAGRLVIQRENPRDDQQEKIRQRADVGIVALAMGLNFLQEGRVDGVVHGEAGPCAD